MDFDSSKFLGFVAISLLLLLTLGKTKLRAFVLLLINGVFLVPFFQSWTHATPLLFFVICGYALVWVAQNVRNTRVLSLSVLIAASLFVYLKKYSLIEFLPFLDFPYSTVGISYILFRIIHLIVDAQGGMLEQRVKFIDYLNFTCFFLSFVSGPIQRFQDFIEQDNFSRKNPVSGQNAFDGFSRLATGYIKVIWVAQVFQVDALDLDPLVSALDSSLLLASVWFGLQAGLFAIYLYVNFSGYMDIVVGIGRLFAFKLPENFDKPFVSTNFIDFWSRWHITLSDWFRIYLFNPIVKVLAYRVTRPSLTPYYGVVGCLATFFVMGLWHGTTWTFFVYGGFLGFGVSVNKLYQVQMRKFMGKKGYSKLKARRGYTYICRGLTFGYFSLAITSFWFTLDQLNRLFGASAILLFWVILCVVALCAAVIFATYDFGFTLLSKMMPNSIKRLGDSYLPRNCWLALKVFLVIYLFISNVSSTPEFIYEAF